LASEKLDYQFTDEQLALIKKGIADKKARAVEVKPEPKKEPEPEEVEEPEDDEPMPKSIQKSLIELDRWQKKVGRAGKMVTWHANDLSLEMVKAITDGVMTFEQARAELVNEPKQDDSIKLLALQIEQAVKAMQAEPITPPAPVYNFTMPPISMTANMPEQKQSEIIFSPTFAPNVQASDVVVQNNTPIENVINVAEPVNNITVKPADVKIPPMPIEAEITTDASGKKTLKVKR
jgi:hypothetical protein